MSPIGALTEKPWLSPGIARTSLDGQREARFRDKGVGLTVFLFVVTILFSIVTVAYLMRMGLHVGILGHAGSDWYPLGEPPLLWFNTGLLFASSLAFHHAWTCARRGEAGRVRMALLAGGLLGFGFLVGQVLLWRHYEASGYVMAARFAVCATGVDPLSITIPETRSGNPAIAFFYLISGLHGIHILGGLAAWAVAARRAIRGEAMHAVARSIQLCARYWHFMLLVWLAMAALFVAT